MSKKSRAKSLKKNIAAKKFPTLAAMLTDYAEGRMSREDFLYVIECIEVGIGLDKRDAHFAQYIEAGSESAFSHPMYVQGFNAGLACGYEAAKDDHRNGVDILTDGQPPQADTPAPANDNASKAVS
jgi:hypothetical protein